VYVVNPDPLAEELWVAVPLSPENPSHRRAPNPR
jgi:hypothetical protein